MIKIDESSSPSKAWSLDVIATPTGIELPARSILFGADRYDVPAMSIQCVYSDDARYRVALCHHANGPAIVLVEDDAMPAGYEEIIAPIRWAFRAPTDTCATVDVHVTRRVLAPRSIEFSIVDVPAHEVQATITIPAHDEPVIDPETGAQAFDADGNYLVEHVEAVEVPVVDENGNPVMRTVDATYRPITIEYGVPTGLHRDVTGETTCTIDGAAATFAELALHLGCSVADIMDRVPPMPTVHAVSPAPVLPVETAERTAGRRRRKRIRDLRQLARDMRDAGTTYAAMTAAQRQVIGELVALDPTGDVPMAVPA